MIRAETWEGFQIICPLHSGSNRNHKCSRQRSWQIRDGVPVNPQEQMDTILGLMQWCAVAGQEPFDPGQERTPGQARKDHMKYMKTRAERTSMLKSQEEIEGMRESHGLTDDEDYTPLVALAQEEEERAEE